MRKLSKSDDPTAVTDIPLERSSDHFKIGSRVKVSGSPAAEIIAAGDDWIDVQHEDGTTQRLWPVALQQPKE